MGRIPETPRPSCYLTFPVHSGACAKWLGEEGHSHAKKCLQCSDSSRKEISLNQMIFAAPSNPNVPLLLLHTTQAHTAAILRGSAGRLKYRTDFSCLQPISASPQAPATSSCSSCRHQARSAQPMLPELPAPLPTPRCTHRSASQSNSPIASLAAGGRRKPGCRDTKPRQNWLRERQTGWLGRTALLSPGENGLSNY